MKNKEYIAAGFIVAALLAVGLGIRETSKPINPSSTPSKTRRDSTSYRTISATSVALESAEQLVRMSTTPDEQALAQEALRLADEDMDLAFASAVRRLTNRPKATTAEAVDAESRLRTSLQSLAKNQAMVDTLTAQLKKASPDDALAITDRLNLAKAQSALDQDAVDDARQDLRRAGGDPQGQMELLIEQHEAVSKGSDSIRIVVAKVAESHGLVQLAQAWQGLASKAKLVRLAARQSDSLAARFQVRHDSVDVRATNASKDFDSSLAKVITSHDSNAILLAKTQQRAFLEKSRAGLDQRVETQHNLVATYTAWANVLAAQQRELLNDALQHVAVILVLLLVATLIAAWIERTLGARRGDRRRTQTSYMVSKVALQLTGALLILLVIFGPPDNLGTFLGLAGAGLTVALKDFIVSFIGWLVLMGRNGIRIGDLVEINGVTGEVVELGMFYTVLLETGGWSDSGHPTGRRVTFTNSFAIEGHYFNFSTSGRWVLDEVHVTVPAGQDAHAIAEALRQEAETAMGELARDAAQLSEVERIPRIIADAGRASINLKPTSGGVDITVRYMTRVNDREELRSALYRTALELLNARSDSSKSVVATS